MDDSINVINAIIPITQTKVKIFDNESLKPLFSKSLKKNEYIKLFYLFNC